MSARSSNEPPLVLIDAFTHRGRLRPYNEDTMTVGDWVSDPMMSAPRRFRHDLRAPLLIAIADGMGGHAAGEVASRYAIEQLASWRIAGAANSPAVGSSQSTDESTRTLRSSGRAQTLLADRLAEINAGMYRRMAITPGLIGMGTTVVGLLLTSERAIWFNVGDSRIYGVRAGRLQQLSVDDVPPGERSGIITQTLGGSISLMPIDPHIGSADLAVPSRWLLCSDGLTDMLETDEIEHLIQAPDDQVLPALFDEAMRAGGTDNISLILASVKASE